MFNIYVRDRRKSDYITSNEFSETFSFMQISVKNNHIYTCCVEFYASLALPKF